MKSRRILFFAALWCLSLILIVTVQVISNRNLKDSKTHQNISRITSSIDEGFSDNNNVPDSIQNIKNISPYDGAPIDTSNITYAKLTNNSYKICTTYIHERLSYDGKKGSADVKIENYDSIPEEHPAGKVCYTHTLTKDPFD